MQIKFNKGLDPQFNSGGKGGTTYLPTIQTQEGPEGIVLGDEARRSQNRGLLIFSAFWIPFVACFTVFMFVVPSVGEETNRGCFALFMIPFWLVSFGLIGYFIKRGLISRKLAPPTLTVRRWPLTLGATSDVIYRRTLRGGGEVQALSATLQCHEWVQYQAGTDTRTATETIWQQELPPTALTPSVEQAEGRWTIQIPPNLPPSFAANRNQIIWSLKVSIKAAGVPDDSTDFILLVRPEVNQGV